MNDPYKLEFNRCFIQVKFTVSEYVALVFENLDLQRPLSQLSSFLLKAITKSAQTFLYTFSIIVCFIER